MAKFAMKSMIAVAFVLTHLLTQAGSLQADEPKATASKGPHLEGMWQGVLKAGVIDLRLVFHFYKKAEGSYTGSMDSIDQGAKGLQINTIEYKDMALRAQLTRIGGTLEGTMGEDGTEITGTWKQSGMTFPLTLKHIEKVPELSRPQTPKKPYPYHEEEVVYENKEDHVKLAGTLTIPRAPSPCPAALLISGSGPQDRDETLFGHKPFLILADYLTRHGIAVLRVDDRGVGGSTGSMAKSTTLDFAKDVEAGIEFLRGRKDIDRHRIGLIGHSEGAIIAPMVASRSRDVAYIVLLAGTGVSGEETLYLQGQAVLKLHGATEEQLKLQRRVQERIFAVAKAEPNDEIALKKIDASVVEEFAGAGEALKNDAPEVKKLVQAQSKAVLSPWFRFFLTYDPRPALRKVQCPVLALNGEKDFQVDPKINLKVIGQALAESGNKDFCTKELPSLNHLFQTCQTGSLSEYGVIEETFAPLALQTIGDWIAKRVQEK